MNIFSTLSLPLSVSILCMLPLAVIAGECKQPDVPADARIQTVAPDMKLNGVPTSIRAFNSSLSVDGVLAYYRNLWARLANSHRPGSMEQTLNEWHLISTVEGDCFTTVQVRDELKGSYALVSVTKKPDPSKKYEALGKDFPLLPGSKVLNDFDYADGVRNARTIVASNRSTLAANLDFYRNEFRLRGWTTMIERQPEGKSGVAYVMVLKKGLEEASVVLSQADDQVRIIANIVDRP